MNAVGTIGSDDAEFLKSQRVTQFSDCIVVSYLVTERSAVFWLLNSIALQVLSLAENGFLVRGGLTVGRLYHSDRHVVGPAMNEAYRIESQVAKYPRIVIDPKVLEVAKRARREGHTPEEEATYAKSFMTKDSDGEYFFDYVSWNSVVAISGGESDVYGSYLGALSKLIRDGLRHDNPYVQEKYLWLHKLYVTAIRQFTDTPSNGKGRKENSALFAEIESLPVFNIDAKLARSAIKKSMTAAKKASKKKSKAQGTKSSPTSNKGRKS
ncbi:hypothetical protein [Cupriavidus plantarum]|uniref:hypothetical protein n=1 Tax=Cupriavidus plantarum TaxID=942865 RepID=UPI001B04EADC|nr:hypothetical protein [Cupriavidus plantarum]CAG2145553.1 hypothetical protein LMG26296_03765 [Cupriavidus plantarum]